MAQWNEDLFAKISKRVYDDYKPEYHLTEVQKHYAQAMTIKESIAKLEMEIVKAEGEYQSIANKKTRAIMDIQNACNHESTTYYGDASGGNDSYDKCDVCGKEV